MINYLISLVFILFVTKSLCAQVETIDVIGTRPSFDGGPPATAFGSGSDKPIKCLDETCGQDPSSQGGGTWTAADTAQALAIRLAELLLKLKKFFEPFGRVKFNCSATVQCQSETVLGGECKEIGVFLTADEAYNNFKNSQCCEMTKQGHLIGAKFEGCGTF